MNNLIKKRGRPEGMRAVQLDIQRRLIEHPDRAKVVEAVYRIALDDEHKHQAAAMKLLMDRMLPISVCDKNADIKEFYLGISSGEKKSFRDVKTYRRRKRWLG